MRVHHLSCGTMCPFGGRWINGDRPVWSTGQLVCHVLLVETDRAGLVLVDSGLGLADVATPRERLGGTFIAAARPRFREEDTAARQVSALGFSQEDVRHIVLTHMDLDHAGGLTDFPRATVHVLADEHAAAMRPATYAERNRYRAVQWAHAPKFETYRPEGEPWRGFPCVRDLRGLPPELLMIPLTGHTRGHAAVAVESASGWLLHAGDAYFHAQQMTERATCPPGLALFQNTVAVDRARMRENQARLRELALAARGEVHVFSAHDPDELARMRTLPEPLGDASSTI